MAKQRRREGDRARHEIEELFAFAKVRAPTEPALAQSYVLRARKLASRTRTSLRSYARVHCRVCASYYSAQTLRVRTRAQTIVYTCLCCGNVRRYRKR